MFFGILEFGFAPIAVIVKASKNKKLLKEARATNYMAVKALERLDKYVIKARNEEKAKKMAEAE